MAIMHLLKQLLEKGKKKQLQKRGKECRRNAAKAAKNVAKERHKRRKSRDRRAAKITTEIQQGNEVTNNKTNYIS